MGKGYLSNEMFELSINNKINVFIYMIELYLSLWHDRLHMLVFYH
jgi:hypothetical protein